MTCYTNYKKCFEDADRIIEVLKKREEKTRKRRIEREKEKRRLAELNEDWETVYFYDMIEDAEANYCYEPDFDKLIGPDAELEELLDSMDRVYISIEDQILDTKNPILIKWLHKKFPDAKISELENIIHLVYNVYEDLHYQTNNNIIRCCLAVFALSTYNSKFKYEDIKYEDIEFLRKKRVLDRGIEKLEKIIISDVVSEIPTRDWGDIEKFITSYNNY